MSSSTSSDPTRPARTRYDAAFFDEAELALVERFEEHGHVIVDVDDRGALENIRRVCAEKLAAETGGLTDSSTTALLESAGDRVTPADLNPLRLRVFNHLNAQPWLRPSYHALARTALHALIGNELAMQRRVNLSIQLPGDDSSLLPVHSDVWSGDSPYELVAWLPLVDCHDTKSMYLLPPAAHARHVETLAELSGASSEALFEAIEPDLLWIEIAVGQVLLFSHTLMHGNRVNRESTARWSLNCRFKSLLSPYDSKRLGEFFEPITTRAATRLGMRYTPPKGFE